jgi:hypothetical protein
MADGNGAGVMGPIGDMQLLFPLGGAFEQSSPWWEKPSEAYSHP